mmetsp:Transcript_65216/g.199483  ORF Transcript_65216/g.199483 Transcript_65216/m.199483 type:complete len:266 (+) Transcript_65216:886-1683(+)
MLRGARSVQAGLQDRRPVVEGDLRRDEGPQAPELQRLGVPRRNHRSGDIGGNRGPRQRSVRHFEADGHHLRRRDGRAMCGCFVRAYEGADKWHADPPAPRQKDPAGACEGERPSVGAPGGGHQDLGRRGVPEERVHAGGRQAGGVRGVRRREAVPQHRGGHRALPRADERPAARRQPGRRRALPGILEGKGVRHRPCVLGWGAQDSHAVGVRQTRGERCGLRLPRHVARAIGLSRGEGADPLRPRRARRAADPERADARRGHDDR